ncbi:MAG TPA: hypothetical protein VJH67_03445 [Candidatus Paceibacterota bacterium]
MSRGTDFIGPLEIESVSDLKMLVHKVPPIFSESEVLRTRSLGETLIYQPAGITMQGIHDIWGNKTSDDHPLLYKVDWYSGEKFYTKDTLRSGWRCTTLDVVLGTRDVDYLQQTAVLVEYAEQKVFPDHMPIPTKEAIKEFRSRQLDMEKLLSRDWQEGARQLALLTFNQLHRETPAEALWRVALHQRVNGIRLLPDGTWTWTNALSSDGYLVNLGAFDSDGVGVGGDDPDRSNSYLGVCFSRSGSLES